MSPPAGGIQQNLVVGGEGEEIVLQSGDRQEVKERGEERDRWRLGSGRE